MFYVNALIIIVLGLAFMTYGYFAKHYGIASVIAGNLLFIVVGIIIFSTGFELQNTSQVVVTVGDTATITKTLISYSWLDTTLGTVMLLFGIAGFISSWDEKKKNSNPYRERDDQ